MKKRRKSLILRLAVFAFLVYIAVTLIHLQLQISRQKAVLSDTKAQYAQQKEKNTEIQRVLSENDKQYMENMARDKLGYAEPGVRFYVNVAGS